jgi:CBS domain-containing protein
LEVQRMQVRQILAAKGRRVVTIRPDATVSTVIHRLALERIGALIVSRDGVRLEGIVSERDIVQGLAERGADLLGAGVPVSEIMTHHVITCTPDDSVKTVMQQMTQRRIRHLPIVDDGRLAGMISIGDVVKNRMEEVELESSVLRDAYIAAH